MVTWHLSPGDRFAVRNMAVDIACLVDAKKMEDMDEETAVLETADELGLPEAAIRFALVLTAIKD